METADNLRKGILLFLGAAIARLGWDHAPTLVAALQSPLESMWRTIRPLWDAGWGTRLTLIMVTAVALWAAVRLMDLLWHPAETMNRIMESVVMLLETPFLMFAASDMAGRFRRRIRIRRSARQARPETPTLDMPEVTHPIGA